MGGAPSYTNCVVVATDAAGGVATVNAARPAPFAVSAVWKSLV